MPKNIFVTGASGRIGRFLITRLCSKDYNVLVLCRKKISEYDNTKINYIIGDILHPDTYSSHLRGVDVMLHMAAVTHTNNITEYYKINSEGTLRLLKICKLRGLKKFIFISTGAISEQGGDYSRSKLIAESYVKESGLDWVILRLAEVYGILGNKGLDAVLNNLHRFPIIPIVGSGKYTITPVHISDVVSSIVEAIEREEIKNKIYNIAGPETFTYTEFIDKVLEIKHSKGVKLSIPLWILKIFLRISASIIKDNFLVMDQLPRLISEKSHDISEAAKDLCFKPSRIEDMIAKMNGFDEFYKGSAEAKGALNEERRP